MTPTNEMKANDYGIKPGDKFGRWTVIKRVFDKKDYQNYNTAYFLCRCSCEKGTEREVAAENLYDGKSKSCGCIRIEQLKNKITHGVYNSPIYITYYHMIERCVNPNNENFYNYGGRGISISQEWYDYDMNKYKTRSINIDLLKNFYNWAITHPTYKNGYSIDRLNPDGNYEPENCIWSDSREQCNNRRTNKYILFNNQWLTIGQVANILGLNYDYLHEKLYNANYDLNSLFVPYTFSDGVHLNLLMYRKIHPLTIYATYFIDDYGRPINEIQYEELQNRLQPAIWNMNEFGFITGPYNNEEED